MSDFKDKMHQIRFLVSVRLSLRWSLTPRTPRVGLPFAIER